MLSGAEASHWTKRVAVDGGTVERQPFISPRETKLSPVHFGPSGTFALTESKDGLVIEEKTSRGPRVYPPPQPTYDQFAAARPQRVQDGYDHAEAKIEEAIGPWQVEDGWLWFGKAFYDGEGYTGVGGFGFFDTRDRRYHLFAPREILDWSVSAIWVDEAAIWLGLVHHGEWGETAGGLLRWDRSAQKAKRIPFEDTADQLFKLLIRS